jgi:hypothetical protein
MKPQISIGLFREGNTDTRLLTSIIKRTFDSVSFECGNVIVISYIQTIEVKQRKFVDAMTNAAKKCIEQYGINILCVHTDADYSTDEIAMRHKIEPALNKIYSMKGNSCKFIVPIIPVQMSEAWMLADKSLLKQCIVTTKSDHELGIDKAPESITDPKQVIEEAIRIARKGLTKRRRKNFNIGELYEPVGENISLESLRQLPSFCKFEDNVRNAFRELKYLN